jgi:Peptidase family C69
MVRAALQSVVVASLVASTGYACTTIAVGKLASTDGSTMATHNADCLDCDFRIGKVPAKDWPEGALRPIVKFRAEFPRTGKALQLCCAGQPRCMYHVVSCTCSSALASEMQAIKSICFCREMLTYISSLIADILYVVLRSD